MPFTSYDNQICLSRTDMTVLFKRTQREILKKAFFGAMMEEEMSEVNINWVRLLPNIVAGLNESPTEALHGKAPEDVNVLTSSSSSLDLRRSLCSIESKLRSIPSKHN